MAPIANKDVPVAEQAKARVIDQAQTSMRLAAILSFSSLWVGALFADPALRMCA
jgi:hypothetical protein